MEIKEEREERKIVRVEKERDVEEEEEGKE